MNRRRVIVNSILGVAVLGLGTAGLVALASPRADPNAGRPTTTVVRGALEATVTASGNIESGVTASLQPAGTGGVVTEVYVSTGQQVGIGDELVALDDAAARQQLDSALAGLAQAEAALTTATQTRSAAERKVDAAGVAAAKQTLANAEKALSAARATYELEKRQQAALVDAAEAARDQAREQQALHAEQLAEAQAELAATDPADTGATAELQARIADLQNRLVTDAAAVASAETALRQATQARDRALLQSRQAVTTQTGNRDSARRALDSQKAQAAVNQQPAKAGTVRSAQAQVAGAQVAVDQARQVLEDTVLRAPFSGVVSTVNAVVGEQSSSAGVTGVTGSTGGGGLVTLVDASGMQVVAAIAEADATAVEVGQAVLISLPASGDELSGEVVAVDVESTVTNNVVQYRTTISLAGADDVRIGQTASVSIITDRSEDVLHVPTSAIASDASGGLFVVRVAEGTYTRVPVTTGMVGTTGTEITSGLDEGDEVLLSNTGDVGGALPTAVSTP